MARKRDDGTANRFTARFDRALKALDKALLGDDLSARELGNINWLQNIVGSSRKPLTDMTPEYRKRVLRGARQGKTRQQARGHTRQESVQKRSQVQRRKVEEDPGLYNMTATQYRSIRELRREILYNLREAAVFDAYEWEEIAQFVAQYGYRNLYRIMKNQVESIRAYAHHNRSVGNAHWMMKEEDWYAMALKRLDGGLIPLPIGMFFYHGKVDSANV